MISRLCLRWPRSRPPPSPTPSRARASAPTALLAGVLALVLAACSPAQAPALPAAPNPALWRIADADSQIWLFGSVHLLPPDLRWRSPRVDAAFAGADELVLETDASEAGAQELQRLASAFGRLPVGEGLSAKLAPPTRERLTRVAQRLRLAPQSLEPLRPWLAALTLSLADALHQGHAPASGVESVLYADAVSASKRVSFLETPEQQIRILADLRLADETRFLEATLQQIEENSSDADAIDAAWRSGDVARLDELVRGELEQAGPAAYDALITRRNEAWAEDIAARLQGHGDVFIAVGAAHLIGKDGVVALLRAHGVEVEGP